MKDLTCSKPLRNRPPRGGMLFLIAMLAGILLPATPRAADTIYWQNINWPPIQILRGEDAGKGRVDVRNKLLQERLPQYTHRNVEMNWTRFWEGLRAGKHVINSMAIKTDERSQYAVFSQIVGFGLPHRIILKRSTLDRLGNPESVALADFVKDPRFRGLIEQKRSYSQPLDDILGGNRQDQNIERKAIEVGHIVKMIVSDRADYTIEYPFIVDYLIKTNHLAADDPLGSIRIEELPRYITAHVAAPKTPWGIQVIKDIDNVLDDIKTTRQYLDIHQLWHSDPRELEQIQNIYTALFPEKRGSVVISGIGHGVTHAMAKAVLAEAYRRIGYDVRFNLLPAKRSLESANQGESDGDIARIRGTEKEFPNLIAVPTPVIAFQAVAFSKTVKRQIHAWRDLKGLKVGVVRGVRYATLGTEGLDRFYAEDIPHLFRLLDDGRIDVAVAGLRAGAVEIRKNHERSGIRTIGGPLFSQPLYHFVHKKNRELVSRIDQALTDMAREGQIESIADRTFREMLAD